MTENQPDNRSLCLREIVAKPSSLLQKRLKEWRTLKKPRKCSGFLLRNLTIVIVDDATENITAAYRAIALAIRFGDRNLLIEALMWAHSVKEGHIFAHDSSKMGLIDDQQLIQAFFPC
jgi:hypothetical protein